MPVSRRQQPKITEVGIVRFVRQNRLNWLLLFIPFSVTLAFLRVPPVLIFLAAAIAIVPLAGLIGNATEELSEHTGPGIGGLLNATFGNATELIIALFALQAGLFEVVKASISGSIIGNILLVLGVSMLVGGWGREKQQFSRVSAGAGASMLVLGVVALVMPAVYDLVVYKSLNVTHAPAPIPLLSLLVAIVLLLTYIASLVFALKTHHALLAPCTVQEQAIQLSKRNALVLLSLAMVLTAIEAEILVGTIHAATQALGMTEFFVGVIVVAIVGNAAEHFSAVTMARKNKMDLAFTIATASSTQIALFVAPVLVIVSFLFGKPMSLVFNAFEVTGIALAVLILSVVSLDGESNWFEGFQLIAVYLVLAIVFFFVR